MSKNNPLLLTLFAVLLLSSCSSKMKDIKQYSEVIDNVSIRNNIQQIVGDI
jgi:hypothetical protein